MWPSSPTHRSAAVAAALAFAVSCFLFTSPLAAQQERPEGCTTITVGRAASFDGSVITSHTLDDHRSRTTIDVRPPRTYPPGATFPLFKIEDDDSGAMPAYRQVRIGEIPQVRQTHGYINTSLPCMNDRQLAIGESTFGGRESLTSDKGLIDLWRLVPLMIERCSTAREAIRTAGELTGRYGWRDVGECLTIADTKEVWHFEIVGPGAGKVGSIWAAQRVPDGHVSVNANASRIRQIDLTNSDYFMASDNCMTVARDSGWWKPSDGPFEFCYAYDPEGRQSFASRRREWRVLDLLAPSLGLHPNAENFPFSVKPDTLVTLDRLVRIFQDYYEGTDFDPTKNITWVTPQGKTEISPFANPFMPYDMLPLFKVHGGWGWRGERTIARWFTVYATITQSRSFLPDPVGGVVWLAWDNAATSLYTPVYCGVTDLPASFKVDGRVTGFDRRCAWWAFNHLSMLSTQRWGDMRRDVEAVWKPLQAELFRNQKSFEDEALKTLQKSPAAGRAFLTRYSGSWAERAVQEAWKLGDRIWTRYDERF
jgi:dipeptidase